MFKYFIAFLFTTMIGFTYFIYYPNVNVSRITYEGEDQCTIDFNLPLMQDYKNETIIKNDYFIKKCDYRPIELLEDIKVYAIESHYLHNKERSLPYKSIYYFYLKNQSIQELKNILESHIVFPEKFSIQSTSDIKYFSNFKLKEYLNINHNEVVLVVRLKNNSDLEFSYFYANNSDIDLYSKKYLPYIKKNVYEFK